MSQTDIQRSAMKAGMDVKAYLRRLYEDYVFFVEELWLARKLDKVAPLGEVERDILRWIQPSEGGPNRRGVLAPRGVGKTTFGTIPYTLWQLYRDPDRKIVVVSKSLSAAKKMVKDTRACIDTVPFLKHLKPRPHVKGGRIWRDNVDMFDVGPSRATKDPSVLALGIEGQLENCRAHLVIGDDVETKSNTQTLDAREDLDARVKDFTSLLYPKGEIVYFGTYWHEESLYLKLANRGYHFRSWSLLYPKKDDRILNLSPMLVGKLERGEKKPGDIVFDHRHDQEYVSERQAEGRTYFAMQQMLICDLGDEAKYPLRLEDLIVFPVQRDQAPISIAWGKNNGQGTTTRLEDIPSLGFGRDGFYAPIMFDQQWKPYTGTKAFLDPSGRGGDEMAWAVLSQLHGHLYLKAIEGVFGGATPENLLKIARSLRAHRVTHLAVETNFGGEYLIPLLQPILRRLFVDPGGMDENGEHYPDGWACVVEGIHASAAMGFKEQRIIDTIEPVTSAHRLVVARSVAEDQEFQRQYTRITRQRNCLGRDDRIDALAGCISLWRLDLEVDTDKAAEQQRQQWIEEQLQKHYALAGIQTPPPRWFQHH